MKSLYFLILCCFILIASEAESAFSERNGVRPLGMAGAFVALADDTSAMMFNPAGLGQIERTEFATAYDKIYAGLGDDKLGRGSISYVHPSNSYGTLGLNLDLLHAPLYSETAVTFGYGTSLKNLYFGLNLRGLFAGFGENEYTKIDPLFKDDNRLATGIALDGGLLYKPSNSVSLGLAVLNANQPNLALDKNADAKLPLTLQTGIALKLGNTIPAIDFVYRNKKIGDKNDINIRAGIESWLMNKDMALRAGMNFNEFALGASYVFSRSKNFDAKIDYAFRYPLSFKEDAISGTYGSHQFSLDIRFGGLSHSSESMAKMMEADDKPQNVDEFVKYAIKFKNEGKYEEGVDLCREVINMEMDQKHRLEVKLLMGSMLTSLEQFTEALEHLNDAVKIAPQDPRTHYELGQFYKQYGAYTGNENLYNKAFIEFEKVKMLDPNFKFVVEPTSKSNKIK